MQLRPQPRTCSSLSPCLAGFGNLFSTHPPIAERIARLTGMPIETQQMR